MNDEDNIIDTIAPAPTNELTDDEKHFLDYIYRPCVMNKRNARELIDDLKEVIKNLHAKINVAPNRVEKNCLYQQIANKQSQIRYAETFLT